MATKNTTTTDRLPGPLYAAAGAGDLAYQQLRKLPSKMADLRERVVELRPVVTDAVSERRLRNDLQRVRDVARRNASALVSTTRAAQDRAMAMYQGLVTRGEQVVRTVRAETAADLAPAKISPRSLDTTEKVKTVPAAKRTTRPATTTKAVENSKATANSAAK